MPIKSQTTTEHDLKGAALRPTNRQAFLQCEVKAGEGEGGEEINDAELDENVDGAYRGVI